jgi:pyroglutamyl-peptidase
MEGESILVTCFEPFGGREENMSRAAVMALPEEAGGRKLRKLCLPVVFGLAAERAAAEAQRLGVSAVLSVGEAGGRKALTPEITALNLRYARIPDNRGQSPLDEPVFPGGPNALFSTLPARKMAAAIAEALLPGEVSYSAGAYVCNDLFYGLLHRFSGTGTRCGFIHVPAEGFAPEALARGLLAALDAI